MTELLTAAQMRAIEKAAIDSGEVTGLELMERAGRGVVEAIFEEWPELAKTDHEAVVLCGPGNNGGDGFVVARLLKEWGWEVEVFLYGDAGKLPVDAKVNCERWLGMGRARPFQELNDGSLAKQGFDLLVDALFGTGLVRALDHGVTNAALDFHLNRTRSYRRVAIDMHSGVCSDSGKILGAAAGAWPGPPSDLTVTFHARKVGHHLSAGPAVSGKIVECDIGLFGFAEAWDVSEHLGCVDPTGEYPLEFSKGAHVRADRLHKYDHGHALVLSGGVGKGGAARMAARGALRIGAGLVSVGCPPAALQENAGALEAIMVRALKGGEGLAEALQDARINALCLGPGLGVKRAADMVALALGDGGVEPRPTVLDADALTAMAGDTELFAKLHGQCVLTPHGGEFARLFPDIAEKLSAPATKGPAYSKVDATREAAARAGCVVLFKGADTVIAAPDGRCSINSAHYERSAPWLATAGSGDVLAGFICGLLARGFAPMQAAETGAWLHVECALKFGPGLIAEDLADQLPAVFRDLGV